MVHQPTVSINKLTDAVGKSKKASALAFVAGPIARQYDKPSDIVIFDRLFKHGSTVATTAFSVTRSLKLRYVEHG